MQHIGLRRESENGEPIADFEQGGIDLRIVTEAPHTSVILRFIDPYGNLVINQLQLPVLIAELEEMGQHSTESEFTAHLKNLVIFLKDSVGVHTYVRFIGD